jgi:uncharacterized RmlC-like cupin family protein
MADDGLQLMETDHEKKFLLDPYLDWVAAEGPPVHEGFGLDLLALETAPWPRFDVKGAFCHVKGRGDHCTTYLLDIDPGKKTAPVKHLYECFIYVLEGHGSTTIELPDGGRHSFEWGPKSLFAIPLNTGYQIFNGSGSERALLACTHFLPLTMNLFHNERFIFDNDFAFTDRIGDPKYYEGDGDFTAIKPGRHMWETTFVPDLTNFELITWKERGAGGSNIVFILADGTLHAHTSEIPTARYKKGHRHGDGIHIFAVTGSGYSKLWYEEDEEFVEIPWRHGIMYAPPLWMFHQHFNTAPEPARYLAIGMGSRRYPFSTIRREGAAGKSDADIKDGGRQVEYNDQDPRLHQEWLDAIAKTGVESDMGEFIDETPYKK